MMPEEASTGVPAPQLSAPVQLLPVESLPQVATDSQTGPPPKLSSYFTQSQFALALAIQKSKPAGLSTIEYCQKLRDNVRRGKGLLPEITRYVDSPGFWKDQYSKIYDEKKVLEDKVHRLEEEQRLRKRTASPEQNSDEMVINFRKRPAQSQDIEGWMNNQQQEWMSEDHDILLRLSSYTLRILRQRSSLDKATEDRSLPDKIEVLSKLCAKTLTLLEAALSDCSIPSWSRRTSLDPRTMTLLQHLMFQIEVSYRSCFDALNELCGTIVGRQKRFDIIYRLVMFFNNGLNHLCTLCNIQAEQGLVDSQRMRSKKNCAVADQYDVNKYLVRLLASMTQMEWKAGQPGHREVLEGILFSVLEHVGKLVSNAVFKEHVAASDRVGNITKGDLPMMPDAAKLETQYIIPVFYAALGGPSSRKELIARVLAHNSAGSVAPPGPTVSAVWNQDMLSIGMKLIQSTLVKGAVGGQELESLNLPVRPETYINYTPEMDVHIEKYGSEWLLESVWALVGSELVAI